MKRKTKIKKKSGPSKQRRSRSALVQINRLRELRALRAELEALKVFQDDVRRVSSAWVNSADEAYQAHMSSSQSVLLAVKRMRASVVDARKERDTLRSLIAVGGEPMERWKRGQVAGDNWAGLSVRAAYLLCVAGFTGRESLARALDTGFDLSNENGRLDLDAVTIAGITKWVGRKQG